MDFYKIIVERTQDPRSKQDYVIYPDFKYRNVTDLVVKGGVFYAFWNGTTWDMEIDHLIDEIDKACWEEYNKLKERDKDLRISIKSIDLESTGIMTRFQNYCKKQKTSRAQFNKQVLFSDYTPKKEDYSTYQLSYSPKKGPTKAFDEMMSTLYAEEELRKILWAIGALLTGEIAKIEKFLYLYGAKGTGKGTIMNIIKSMFGDYWKPIDLQFLTGTSEFATSGIEEVPMLIDSDTDLSKIKKEVNLLKLTSHEELIKRKLYQDGYPVTFKGLLITASNDRYTLKSKDSGMTRRPIVVKPTGNNVSFERYQSLMSKIEFETAAIAQKCIDTFNSMGAAYYQDEVDVDMISYSDKVFDFIRENEVILSKGTTLTAASSLYKLYLEDMGWDSKGAKRELKNELSKYYTSFAKDTKTESGERVYNFYSGFRYDVAFPEGLSHQLPVNKKPMLKIEKDEPGMFDVEGRDWPAQYATPDGYPEQKWDNVRTTLKDIDPYRLHYVRVPSNHIVLDFDIKNPETGEKDFGKNVAKASLYPETYSEISKSGGGIHLHYYYDGDVSKLANHIEDDIEIKVYTGRSSLRRKFTYCSDAPIAHISTGLPLKEEKSVLKDIEEIVWTEKRLKGFIEAALRKEHHGSTKPEIDFIKKVLDDAKASGVSYDLSSMLQHVLIFAMRSTNNKDYCMKLVSEMPFSTIEESEKLSTDNQIIPDEDLYFYDIEVFSNLLLVCWKKYGFEIPDMTKDNKYKDIELYADKLKAYAGELHKDKYGIWFNPTPQQIEWLLSKPLVGFNNRKYDNHIMYNRLLGADNLALYTQSQNIIGKVPSAMMQPAYGLSYADVYEFMDIKQSLKKWEISLGISHDELEFPWDQPLEFSNWDRAGIYCMNDVVATEAVFSSKAGQEAYTARKILCELTDLPINFKTQTLAEKFLFGDDPRPQDKFNWYDLAKEFPGYEYSFGKSTYHGKDPSEGGYVFSKPGVYRDVWLDDVESLHPHSLIAINYFGPYTPRFAALVKCRMYIKHGEFDKAAHAFDDIDMTLSAKLAPFLKDKSMAEGLGHAMKIVINIVYGMSSAKYDNKFRDPRNVDNIVAKRGALFMMMLQEEVEARGYNVIHIKTDSMKIENGDAEIHAYMQERAHAFGYNFDHEANFDKLALTNKATIIGHISWHGKEKKIGTWEATGAQYAMPYVYKKLFSGEDIVEQDFFMLKSAKDPIKFTNKVTLGSNIEVSDNDRFVGKNAYIYASKTGQNIYADRGETKAAITGTKGYLWKLAAEYSGKDDVDIAYYDKLVSDGVDDIFDKGDGNIIFKGTKWERPIA